MSVHPKNAFPLDEATQDAVFGTEGAPEPRPLAEVFVTRRIASIYAGGSENVRVAAFRAIAQEEVDGEFFFTDEYEHTTTVVVSTQRHGSNT